MYLDPARLTRGSTISQYQISRGGTVGAPKSKFGQKLTTTNLLASLDSVHQRVRTSSNAAQLADLLDEYVALAALLAGTYVAAPFVPGGSVLSAAISGMGGLGGAAGG